MENKLTSVIILIIIFNYEITNRETQENFNLLEYYDTIKYISEN